MTKMSIQELPDNRVPSVVPIGATSSWDSCDARFLDSYLIQETENPCINVASVLLRSLLADSLFPEKFDTLIHEEFHYSAAASFALLCAQQGCFSRLHESVQGTAALPGEMEFPTFLQGSLPFDFPALLDSLAHALQIGFEAFQSPFETRWQAVLSACEAAPMSVLELACGSANDARYFSRYGLEKFLRYTGVDFTSKNIINARRHFPAGNFQVADVCTLPFADKTFDYTYACDLFEHLEEEKLEMALREAIRVTRRELWFSFFNLDWIPDHIFEHSHGRPLNTLSCEALMAFFKKENCETDLINISCEWSKRFPGYIHYNQNACLLMVRV